jgi:hypothetical protein
LPSPPARSTSDWHGFGENWAPNNGSAFSLPVEVGPSFFSAGVGKTISLMAPSITRRALMTSQRRAQRRSMPSDIHMRHRGAQSLVAPALVADPRVTAVVAYI